MAGPSFIPRNSAVHQVRAYLLINEKQVPIVSAQIEYTLNQIPSALVKVPSGVTVSGASKVLLEPADLQGRTPAAIVIEGLGGFPHPAKIRTPLEPAVGDYEITVFDGYIQSSSINVSTSGTSTTVALTGLLSDLDLSSFAAGDFDKTSPSDWFIEDALLTSVELVPMQTSDSSAVSISVVGTGDWWSDIVQPAMVYKAGRPLSRFSGSPPQDSGLAIDGLNSVISAGLTLRTDVRDALPSESEKAIHQQMARIVGTGEGGSSAFDKLLSIFSEFGVVLSPRVYGAELMPYRPVGSVDDEGAVGTLYPEVFDLGASSANPVQISAGSILYRSGAGILTSSSQPDPATVDDLFIGEYVPTFSSAFTGGSFKPFEAPRYLAVGLSTSYQPRLLTDIRTKVRNSTLTGAQPAVGPPAPTLSPNEVRPLTNALAKQHYFNNSFATKTQDLILGFTTSYAPGQRVKYEYPAKNVSGLSNINTCRGTIESVVYSFAAEPASISTFLRLRHVMNDADMELFGSDATDDFRTLFDYSYDFKNGIIEP